MAGKILFFGKLADISGAEEWPMPAFDGELSDAAFISRITDGYEALAEALNDPKNRICVNQTLFPPSAEIRVSASDEVAFLPPMSGG